MRNYQEDALEKLRDGFRGGHRTQLLYAPCGAGKTELAVALMQAAAIKGTRSAMIVDRRVLCDQTSARLWKYNIDHGVLMAGSSRWRPELPIQVCTAQTLEAREGFPDVGLLIVDEAHCQRQSTTEFIKNHPKIRVIGLSGSPFTKGLGAVYTAVQSAIPISAMISAGWLVPPRVFVAKQIDMTGAKKVAGEWSAKEATTRGVKITADVVSEWVKKTHEVFGGPRKTIVFCAGVAHGEDLSRQFAEAGYNFVSISYRDDDDYKQEVLAEFNKPDTEINGIIATDILTKGFDQSDVMIGVSARPFSKSFSSHVQQLGRVMRPHADKSHAIWMCHCVAGDQRVLTHRGLVRIDRILLSDRIWDGIDFVTHRGVVSRGIRPVIRYAGITATPDHLIETADEGWCSLGYCADKQKSIVTTGVGGTALRECDDYRTGGNLAGRTQKAVHACSLRMRNLRISIHRLVAEFTGRENEWVHSVWPAKARAGMAECQSGGYAGAVQKPEAQSVSELRGQRDRIQVRLGDWVRSLDKRELGLLGRTERNGIRSDQQQRALRAGKYPVGDEAIEPEQQKKFEDRTVDAQIQDRTPRSAICGRYIASIFKRWSFFGCYRRALSSTVTEAEREVWDILDCGPRHRFTCEGLLVHNSGNFLRFHDQWEALCERGVDELDDGAEKPKPEPTDKEKEASKCPQCGCVWSAKEDVCANCGHVRVRRNDVIEVAGQMEELSGTGKKADKYSSDYKREWYQGLIAHLRAKGKNENRAFHLYREKFKCEPAWKKVAGSQITTPAMDAIGFLWHANIKFAKSQGARR